MIEESCCFSSDAAKAVSRVYRPPTARALLLLTVTVGLIGPFVVGCAGDDQAPETAALTPPASGLVDEVPAQVRKGCEQALAKSDVDRVYCPPIVPEGQSMVGSAGEYVPGSYYVSFENAGIEPEPHWLIEGGAAKGELLAEFRSKLDTPRRLGIRQLSGVAVRLYAIDFYDINGGHVVALWRFDGREYVASVHGFANKELTLGITRGLIEQQQTCESDPSAEVCELVYGASRFSPDATSTYSPIASRRRSHSGVSVRLASPRTHASK